MFLLCSEYFETDTLFLSISYKYLIHSDKGTKLLPILNTRRGDLVKKRQTYQAKEWTKIPLSKSYFNYLGALFFNFRVKRKTCSFCSQNFMLDSQSWRGYVTVNGRRTFGVALPILKGRQLHIHCSDSKRSFFTKTNIDHSNNYDPSGPNRKKMGSRY